MNPLIILSTIALIITLITVYIRYRILKYGASLKLMIAFRVFGIASIIITAFVGIIFMLGKSYILCAMWFLASLAWLYRTIRIS